MGVIDILRRVTATVKVFPFIYTFGILLYWLIAPALSETALTVIDEVVYMSAIVVLLLIRLSYCVKLCIWHRLQCMLPLLPQVAALVDEHIYEFGIYTATINYIVTLSIFALSLVNAYKVFIRPTTEQQ